MENSVILIDTSILIDYFRKEKKDKTILYNLSQDYNFSISSITEFEFLSGFKDKDLEFARELLKDIVVIPFDSGCAKIASDIYKDLKANNLLIEPPDIFIAATAIYKNLPLATLNVKHFQRIAHLNIII